jgi:hypothetical protein
MRWKAASSAFFLIPQDPGRPDRGLRENQLATQYPKTYAYLVHFRDLLLTRSGFKKFLEPQGEPFYALYDVGPYTFEPYKVVWMRISDSIKAAVDLESVPDNGVTFVGLSRLDEAHYLCAMMNSSPFGFAVASFSVAGTGTWGAPHILRHVKIPEYDPSDPQHGQLCVLSMQAHEATAHGDTARVREIETEIDRLAAQLWGLTEAELKEIQESLAELG